MSIAETLIWKRRSVLRASIAFGLLLTLGGAKTAPQEAMPVDGKLLSEFNFQITRKGKNIGAHHVRVVERDGLAHVDIGFQIRVKILGFTAFRMDHKASEQWDLDTLTLARMSAVTDRSSGVFEVKVGPSEDGYTIDVNGAAQEAPAGFVPTSFTFASHVFDDQDKDILLLDTLSGLLRPSRILHKDTLPNNRFEHAVGDVRYYEIIRLDTGEVSHRIWYDDDDAFLRVGLSTKDGHYVEYNRLS